MKYSFAIRVLTIVFGVGLEAVAATGGSGATQQNDLRDLNVGEAIADFPKAGYAGFACAAQPKLSLNGWHDWQKCPPDPSGLRAIRFGYDPTTDPDGTKVAGHPVILELLVGEDARVDGLRIMTDPASRLYLRKKAFLLGLQAKARYGAEGWTCAQGAPSADEQPIGGVYIKEQCKKRFDGRDVVIERNLFTKPGRDLKDFVGETRIKILRTP
jgi:hypothetical protein